MSNQLINRLEKNNFKFYNHHKIFDGGHIAPLERFNLVFDFLEEHFPVE